MPLLARFERHFIPEPNTGCWLWVGATRANGYGVIGIDKQRPERRWDYAHRVSWLLHRGNITKNMMVLHRCDVRCCVNPDHLFLGTQADNMQDALRKNRLPTAVNGRYKTKLSISDVIAIRASMEGPAALSRRYGVRPTHICAIQKGRKRLLG